MASVEVPSTSTITSFGLVILAQGDIVGAITSWSVDQQRGAKAVFELGSPLTTNRFDVAADPGEPFEIVPGNITGTTISIRRYDIYTKRFESAFKTRDLYMLTRQNQPVTFREAWSTPGGTLDFGYTLYGAWFTRLGREMSAEGDRIVMVNGSAMYTRRRPT